MPQQTTRVGMSLPARALVICVLVALLGSSQAQFLTFDVEAKSGACSDCHGGPVTATIQNNDETDAASSTHVYNWEIPDRDVITPFNGSEEILLNMAGTDGVGLCYLPPFLLPTGSSCTSSSENRLLWVDGGSDAKGWYLKPWATGYTTYQPIFLRLQAGNCANCDGGSVRVDWRLRSGCVQGKECNNSVPYGPATSVAFVKKQAWTLPLGNIGPSPVVGVGTLELHSVKLTLLGTDGLGLREISVLDQFGNIMCRMASTCALTDTDQKCNLFMDEGNSVYVPCVTNFVDPMSYYPNILANITNIISYWP